MGSQTPTKRALTRWPWSGFAASAASLAVACGGSSDAGLDAVAATDAADMADSESDSGQTDAPSPEGVFLPVVRLGGTWRGGGRDGPCAEEADGGASCPAGAGIRVHRSLKEGLSAWVELSVPATVEALALETEVQLEGITSWISNGFQSWSQSGALAIGSEPTAEDTHAALTAYGDLETIRDGAAVSWWYTAVGGGADTWLAWVAKPLAEKAWVQVWRDAGTQNRVRVRLGSGGTGPRMLLPAGTRVDGELWQTAWKHEDQTGAIDAMAQSLRDARGGGSAPLPLLGWNSWYELWDSTTEADARANLSAAQTALDPLPAPAGRWLVVDDAWQTAWGDWTPNTKFPSGLAGLSKDVRAAGWHFGVWLAPFLVDADLALVKQHPDWFLPGVTFYHLKNGEMRVLDVTHPAAAAHLTGVIEQLATWGVELIKIDFLFAALLEAPRHDGKSTALSSYRAGLQMIRNVATKHGMRVVAVGAPPVPTLEFADGWRSGTDIAVENFGAVWAFVPNQLRALAARIPYCAAIACDVDPPILRAPLTAAEVDFGLWIVALAGGGYFLSDDLQVLPKERLAAGLTARTLSLALSGKVARPTSLFPANPPATLSSAIFDQIALTTTQIVPQVWKTADGQRVVLNAADVTATIDGLVVPPHSAVADPQP